MKKTLLVVSLLLLVAAVAFAADKEPVRIGYLASLTGEAATWGQHEYEAAMLAVEEINAAGGILDRPVELFVTDIRGRPEDAVNGARKLIEVDKVCAIGGSNFSSVNMAINPILEKYEIPVVGTVPTNPAVTVDPKTNTVRPYQFRICFTDPYQGKIMAEYLHKLGVKKPAIVYDVGLDYAVGMKQYFLETWKALGGEIAGEWGYRGGDVDFRAQLTEAKNTGADALVMPDLYKEMALMIKQSAELGWKPIAICGDGYSPNMYEIAGEPINGLYVVMHFRFDDPKFAPLLDKFEKKYSKKATEIGNVVFAYDVIYLLKDAITRAGSTDGKAIAKALAETKDLQLFHFKLTFDANHNPLNKPADILQFQIVDEGGKKVGKEIYIETVAPQAN